MGSRRTVLRGGRLGGAAGSEVDRGGPVEPRRTVSYWCDARHESRPQFAADVEPPESWECHVCGQPAGVDRDAPPAPLRMAGASHKTPYEFLMMRRTPAEGEKLLAEALEGLQALRAEGRRAR
jgi:hypothetical protein